MATHDRSRPKIDAFETIVGNRGLLVIASRGARGAWAFSGRKHIAAPAKTNI
jgi:hypothetical protein